MYEDHITSAFRNVENSPEDCILLCTDEPRNIIKDIILHGNPEQLLRLEHAWTCDFLYLPEGATAPTVKVPEGLPDGPAADFPQVVLRQVIDPTPILKLYGKYFSTAEEYLEMYETHLGIKYEGEEHPNYSVRKTTKHLLKAKWQEYLALCRERKEIEADYKLRVSKMYQEYITLKKSLEDLD